YQPDGGASFRVVVGGSRDPCAGALLRRHGGVATAGRGQADRGAGVDPQHANNRACHLARVVDGVWAQNGFPRAHWVAGPLVFSLAVSDADRARTSRQTSSAVHALGIALERPARQTAQRTPPRLGIRFYVSSASARARGADRE